MEYTQLQKDFKITKRLLGQETNMCTVVLTIFQIPLLTIGMMLIPMLFQDLNGKIRIFQN